MNAIDWLLEATRDPLAGPARPADAPADVVAAERARVASEGWGARILALRATDGLWEGGALFPARDGPPLPWSREEGQPWTATAYSLVYLLDFGVDPATIESAGRSTQVRANARWENDNQPYFEGETEPCINGMVVAQGAYFGVDVDPVVERLVGEQLERRRLELRGRERLGAWLVPHDDPRPRGPARSTSRRRRISRRRHGGAPAR